MSRPRVDVVVPFRGSSAELEALGRRLGELSLREGDSIVVVDNGPEERARASSDTPIRVLRAAAHATPGYARNRGAALGEAAWLVFVDADTEAPADLIDRYFDPAPGPETVLLAGGVIDEGVPPDAPGPARYAFLRRTLTQERTFGLGEWGFAQTANVACRRDAFEAIGGFREDIRAAEDADLNYRLRARGGEIERREGAAVVHRNRRTLRAFVAQAALHGAGGAWLDRAYPGSIPPRRRPGLIWWGIRFSAKGLIRAARARDRDVLIEAVYEPLWELSFEFGRSFSVVRGPSAEGEDREPSASLGDDDRGVAETGGRPGPERHEDP